MAMTSPFAVAVSPDWEELLRCVQLEGEPQRVHHMEILIDAEILDVLCQRYEIDADLDRSDPFYGHRRYIALQRFLGYDEVKCSVENFELQLFSHGTDDTAALAHKTGRSFTENVRGPITNWEEFERYPWPRPEDISTRSLEFYQKNLPDDMCIAGLGTIGHNAEHLTWLMGYETLCVALFEQRDLVAAIAARLNELYERALQLMLQFDRVKIVWGPDDMGFNTATLISPNDLREFALPGHKRLAQMAHDAGRLYFLHSCGNVGAIMEDCINDVKIDAKHSYQNHVADIFEAKDLYGERIGLLGGIDLDFLCRASEEAIRAEVRKVLNHCHRGGGYVLGSGNSIANYVPVDNFLAMIDEGRRFGA